MYIQACFILFVVCTIIQLVFWWGLFSKLAFYKNEASEKDEKEPENVSIIVCAKNEATNLAKYLHRLLSQNYRSYEVIVVNHNSTDQTEEVARGFQEKFPYLRIVNTSNKKTYSQVGKKSALAEGIKSARHDVLLLTDADCEPNSDNWLAKMQSLIHKEKKIVLGFSPYRKKPGLLNLFIRYETIYTAVQYFSFALAKMPYMGVGRNLAYRKHLFLETDGFKKHQHIVSGDDDLFINEVADSKNVAINIDRETFVFSDPKDTWKSYFKQKTRHLTTGTAYKSKHKVLLGMLSITHFGHYIGGLLLISQYSMLAAVVLLYLIRIVSVTVLHVLLLRKFQDMSMLKWIPLLDATYVLYYLIFTPYLFFGNRNQWT